MLLKSKMRTRKSVRTIIEENHSDLKKILEHLEIEKKSLGEYVAHNVEKLLLPMLKKLKTHATTIEGKYLDLLEADLKALGGKFGMVLSKWKCLTPKEAQICNMIKNGLSTKEIAQFFKISDLTIGTHRTNIRKKLKISNHKANLAVYLQQD